MFSIRYKVFFDEIYDDHELKGADGYFQIQVDNENYGLLLSEELDVFSVSVYWWFYYFLEATELLKNEKQVYISDIETPQVWIELKKLIVIIFLLAKPMQINQKEAMQSNVVI